MSDETTDAPTDAAEDAQQPQEGQDDTEQQTFDAKYVKKLREENAKHRTEAKANAEAAKRLAAFEAEQEKAKQTAGEREAAAEKRAEAAEAKALRLDVAFSKGLTPAQAKRLVGSTKDELEADADEILRDFPTQPADRRPRGDADIGTKPPTRQRSASFEDAVTAGIKQQQR